MTDAAVVSRSSEGRLSEIGRVSLIEERESMKTSEIDSARLTGVRSELDSSKARDIRGNFILMSIAFSSNHGCVMTASDFASSDFPNSGNMSNGALYATYCFSALFLSGAVMAVLGTKRTLICGLVQYTIYVMTFFVAAEINSGFLIILGAAFSGFGGGYLWVAQGVYFIESIKVGSLPSTPFKAYPHCYLAARYFCAAILRPLR
jgi:MFS family permease